MGNWMLASVNYSFSKHLPSSLGIAFEFQTDELHVMISTNNIYGVLNAHNTRSYNFQFGIGWQINKEQKMKVSKNTGDEG
jgi:hypothetical protein